MEEGVSVILEDRYALVIVKQCKAGWHYEVEYTYKPNGKKVTYAKYNLPDAEDFAIRLFRDKEIVV